MTDTSPPWYLLSGLIEGKGSFTTEPVHSGCRATGFANGHFAATVTAIADYCGSGLIGHDTTYSGLTSLANFGAVTGVTVMSPDSAEVLDIQPDRHHQRTGTRSVAPIVTAVISGALLI